MNAAEIRAARVAAIDALNLKPGDVVRSVYGDRAIVRVSAKSVSLPGSFGKPIRLDKHLIIALVARA